MSFAAFGLSPPIVRAVTERGYTVPTPIQRQAIPAVLSGGDLLAGAQTGTGKTAGFALPILHRLSVDGRSASAPDGRAPIRALILTPTRELAAQVEESVREYGKYLKLKSMVMFGGVGIQPQIQQLRGRVDILVATPGRLLDHVGQRTLDLSRVEMLVLDDNLLNRPTLIEVARRNAPADAVTQRVHPVDRERKRELLAHLIRENNWRQVLVFTRTKHGANRLSEQLSRVGIPALAIHGNKSQSARTRALAEFKSGKLPILVATDIAARGIDIVELPHVVNFELPNVPEDYVHRIGRTGRAGAAGEAVSLVCVDEHKLLADIEKVIRRALPRDVIPGFEPDPRIRAEPIPNGRGRGPLSGRGQPGPVPARAEPARPNRPRWPAAGQEQPAKMTVQTPRKAVRISGLVGQPRGSRSNRNSTGY